MNRMKVFGWLLSLGGSALWVYGYFWGGAPSLIDWTRISPPWISEFLPNLPCEIGLLLNCFSIVPLYWPANTKDADQNEPVKIRSRPDANR